MKNGYIFWSTFQKIRREKVQKNGVFQNRKDSTSKLPHKLRKNRQKPEKAGENRTNAKTQKHSFLHFFGSTFNNALESVDTKETVWLHYGY